MRTPLAFAFAALASAAFAQTPPSPAQMGVTPPAPLQSLEVLDANRVWVKTGTIDPNTHTFTSLTTPIDASDIRGYGGVADGRIVYDASTSGLTTLVSPTAAFTAADVGMAGDDPLAGGPYKLANALISSTLVPASFNAAGFIAAAPGGSIANPYKVGDTETLATTGGTCATAPVVTNATIKLTSAALVAGGSGYPISATFNVVVASGTWAVPAIVSVTTNASGVVTTVNSVVYRGRATTNPTFAASPTTTGSGQTGTGLTLNLGTGLDILTVTTPGACTAPPTTNPLTIASTSGTGTGATVIAYFTAPPLQTSISAVVDASHATLAAPATVDAPASQMAAIFTDNSPAMIARRPYRREAERRLHLLQNFRRRRPSTALQGRIQFLAQSGCLRGDGAPINGYAGLPAAGSWILAAHDDVGLYFRTSTPVVAANDATADLKRSRDHPHPADDAGRRRLSARHGDAMRHLQREGAEGDPHRDLEWLVRDAHSRLVWPNSDLRLAGAAR